MVTVVDYALRKAKEDGREFIALVLQGGLSLVQSKQSGNFYATVKQTSIPSTFDEATAKGFISESPVVSAHELRSYGRTNKETGEVWNLRTAGFMFLKGATLEKLCLKANLNCWQRNSQV